MKDKVSINYAKGCGITDLNKDGFGEAVVAAKVMWSFLSLEALACH